MTSEELMFDALRRDDGPAVERLLARDRAVRDQPWPGGGGAGWLYLAAAEGLAAVCDALLAAGADPDAARPANGAVPLGAAAQGGHLGIVERLLAHGASVDAHPESHATPLMAAALHARPEVAHRLLDAGADVNREHLRLPQTALDFAECRRPATARDDAVAALLRAHGGVRPYTEPHDWGGVPGAPTLRQVQRACGPVAPKPLREARGGLPAVYRCRLPPRYTLQLLFTVGPGSPGVAMCLPAAWPLDRLALARPHYAWPVHALQRLAAWAAPRAVPSPAAVWPGSGATGEPSTWIALARPALAADGWGAPGLVLLTAPPRGGVSEAPERLARAHWETLALPPPHAPRHVPTLR